jgi:hypothetical protein
MCPTDRRRRGGESRYVAMVLDPTAPSAIVIAMETVQEPITLWPRWMTCAGAMLAINALARSRCMTCGTLLRVDLADVVARHGPGHRLIDRLERCSVVGCTGSIFYLASRSYGRPWTTLVRDPELAEAVATAAPPRTALG